MAWPNLYHYSVYNDINKVHVKSKTEGIKMYYLLCVSVCQIEINCPYNTHLWMCVLCFARTGHNAIIVFKRVLRMWFPTIVIVLMLRNDTFGLSHNTKYTFVLLPVPLRGNYKYPSAFYISSTCSGTRRKHEVQPKVYITVIGGLLATTNQ